MKAPGLGATAILTALAVAVSLFFDSGPVAAAALLPLVLILPGYALAALLLAPGSVDRGFRTVMTIALSIGATAISGLVIQIFVPLTRGVVIASLAAVTLAACRLATKRPHAPPPSRRRPTSVRAPAASVVVLIAAVAVAAAALAIASGGARRQMDSVRFSALWLVPTGSRGSPPIQIGVSSQEGSETPYRLALRQGGSAIDDWRLRLGAGDEWQRTVPADRLSKRGQLVALLYRSDELYRRVAIRLAEPLRQGHG